MKIIVITRFKDLFYTIPASEQLELMKESMAYVEKYRRAGKCKDTYNVPGLDMSVSIWEVESSEELDKLFIEFSLTIFMNLEIYILSDFDTNMNDNLKKLELLAKM